MTTKTAVVVVVAVRGVLNILKALGGFPYSWSDAPSSSSPIPSGLAHTDVSFTSGNSASNGDNTSAGCWAEKRKYAPCQQLCPGLRRGLAHKVWVVVMSLIYLVIIFITFHGFLKNEIPQYLNSNAILFIGLGIITGIVLICLLFHLVMRSDHLVTLISHLDSLPPGQSLHTWASIRIACGIPIPVTLLATSTCTLILFPARQKSQSLTDWFMGIILYLGNSLLTFILLMTYNALLYLLCVMLAAQMRDLRITLEGMREKRGVRGVREVAGPVLCDMWRAQTLLNTYLGPPVMVIAAVMIFVFISNVYDIFTIGSLNVFSYVYGLADFLNLVYLCYAPGMVHDQVRGPWTIF
uniref:Uncharacterized protein n=1 Tax=Scylla olivacea TaxID=85551 RepID=A0A0P4VWF3_SCYOL